MSAAAAREGSAPSTAAPKESCAHCHGRVETVGQGRGNKSIKRCVTCGRSPDPEPSNNGHASPTPRAFVDLAPGSAPRPCRVEGCPGTLDSAGTCACCVKRAAWELANTPKRECEICGGTVTGRGLKKFCDACNKAKARVGYHKTKPAKK